MGKIIKIEKDRNKNDDNRAYFYYKYFGLIIFISFIIIIGLGVLLIIKPKFEDLKNIKIEIDSNEKLYLEKKEILKNMSSNNKVVNKENVEKIEKMLLNKNNIEEFITQIDNIVRGNGLILSSISINDSGDLPPSDSNTEATDTGIGVVNLSMTIENVNYTLLKKLLASFENNLNIIDIKTLGFSGEDGSSVNISATSYYFK